MNHADPPGPPSEAFGRNHLAEMRRDLIGFCKRLQGEYGDVAYFRLGPFPCYQFTHPDHVQEILVHKARSFRKPARLKQVFGRFEGNGLVVSDGDVWARQHRLVQSAFRMAQLRSYASVITASVEEMLDGWSPGCDVELLSEMRKLTLRIVTQTLFSTAVDDVIDEVGEAVGEIQHWSIRELNRVLPTPKWLPLIGQPRARRAIRFIDRLVWRIIRERRATAAPSPDDLLGRLLDAADSEGHQQHISDRQVRDELVTLLLAGHETSAAALAWAVWLLARHCDDQHQVAGQVRSALSDRLPEFEDLQKLEAVEQVFKESMRLYPPVYFLSREVAENVEIAGYHLRPQSQVYLNPYLTHRDSRWFPDPERFDMQRFAPENEKMLPTCAWFPFGAGPRACIGRGFAMMEGILVLASLLQRFRLEPASGQGDPELEWQLSLHPKSDLRLNVRTAPQSAQNSR